MRNPACVETNFNHILAPSAASARERVQSPRGQASAKKFKNLCILCVLSDSKRYGSLNNTFENSAEIFEWLKIG